MLNMANTEAAPPAVEVHKWDLRPMYATTKEWQQDAARLEQAQKDGWFAAPTNLDTAISAEALAELLDKHFTIDRELTRLGVYAHLWSDENLGHAPSKEAYDRAARIIRRYNEHMSWLRPYLAKMDNGSWQQLRQSEALTPYSQWLTHIDRLRAHTLSEEGERLMAMASAPLQTASKTFRSLSNVDMQLLPVADSHGEMHPMSQGLWGVYSRSEDRTLRKNAFDELHGSFAKYQHTLADLLIGQVELQWFHARARGFQSVLDASLSPDAIPLEVYHQLIAAVRSHLPTLHRYMDLRSKVMGLDQLEPYDLYVPLVESPITNVEYDNAVSWVIESVAPLGDDYQQAVRKGLMEEGWVHVYEQPGKRSGAYSSGFYDSHPYILLNYRNTVNDAFTLAHEMGHSMHSKHANASNPYWHADYPIFVAEVASTFNEQLLNDHLRKIMPDKQAQAYLLEQQIESVRLTVVRQTMFAEFELWLNEAVEQGAPLSAERLSEKYAQLVRDYYGPRMSDNALIAYEWSRIPHFYSAYYVYQYATGLASAQWLHDMVVNGGEEERQRYRDFLRTGGSKDPVVQLEHAGVPLRSGKAVEATMQNMARWLSELEQYLGQ